MHKNQQDIPAHIGFILDGNRRWAKARGLAAMAGHEAGVLAVKRTLDYAQKLGIKVVSLFMFSTENWKRSALEVNFLMEIFVRYIKKYGDELYQKGAQIRLLGDPTPLFPKLKNALEGIKAKTKENHDFFVNLCINYGGRAEILRAFQHMLAAGPVPAKLTEEYFSKFLGTAGEPDPALIIRTSGEQRTSGFLTWQSVYSELYFMPIFWPDFDEKALDQAIEWYGQRARRFGK